MTRKRIAAVVAVLTGGACIWASGSPFAETSAPDASVPRSRHVILVVFENRSEWQVLDDHAATAFRRLAKRYATLKRYDAVAHPSLPDYLALVAGSTFGVRSDCTRCVFNAPNMADTLAARSLTWKTYVENIPPRLADVYTPAVKARIPFLYFKDVLSSPRRMQSIVPLAAFARDLRAKRLPNFSLVIPDLCHDMHNCSVRIGNRWLASFMQPLLRPGALKDSVVFVVFDEARWQDSRGGGGHVPAIVAGPLVRRGSTSSARLSHYNLLRTIEVSLRLHLLGHSATAKPITGIWR